MSDILSDTHKLREIKNKVRNKVLSLSRNVKNENRQAREAKEVGKFFDDTLFRYSNAIRAKIRQLVVNSEGKDLGIGKILSPYLKVLWYECLHEGLFSVYKINKANSYKSDKNKNDFNRYDNPRVIEFATIDLSGRGKSDENKPKYSERQQRILSRAQRDSAPRGVQMLAENIKDVDSLSPEVQTRILDHVQRNPGQYREGDLDLIYESFNRKNKIRLRDATKSIGEVRTTSPGKSQRMGFVPSSTKEGQRRIQNLQAERADLKTRIKSTKLTKEEAKALRDLESLSPDAQNAIRLRYLGREIDPNDPLSVALNKSSVREDTKRLKETTRELRDRGVRVGNPLAASKSPKTPKEPKGTKVRTNTRKGDIVSRGFANQEYDEIIDSWDTLSNYDRSRVIKKLEEQEAIRSILESSMSKTDKDDSLTVLLKRQAKVEDFQNFRPMQIPNSISTWIEENATRRKAYQDIYRQNLQLKISTSDKVTEEKVLARSNTILPKSESTTKEEIKTILANKKLTDKEKVIAIDRLTGPGKNRTVRRQVIGYIKEREGFTLDSLVNTVHTARLGEDRAYQGVNLRDRLKSLLSLSPKNIPSGSRPGTLARGTEVDIRERIRDIETYYPYLTGKYDAAQYMEARTLELSNYYEEEFKNGIKDKVAELYKNKDITPSQRKKLISEMISQVETGTQPLSKADSSLITRLKESFNKSRETISTPNPKDLENLESKARKIYQELYERKKRVDDLRAILNTRVDDVVAKEEAKQSRKKNKKAIDVEEKQLELKRRKAKAASELYPLLGMSEKPKSTREFVAPLEAFYEEMERLGLTSETKPTKFINNYIKKNTKVKPKDVVPVDSLPPDLVEELKARGLLRRGKGSTGYQETISQKAVDTIAKKIRTQHERTQNRYTGVNPIVVEEHKSLQEARRQYKTLQETYRTRTARGLSAKKPPSLQELYIQTHKARLGRDLRPDEILSEAEIANLDNLVVNPYQRLDRILNNEITTAYNLGRVESFVENGVEQVRWVSRLDSKTSTFCTSLHNRIFNLAEIRAFSTARGLVYPYFPNTKRTFDQVRDASPIGVFYVPSVHPFCRSYLEPVPPQEELTQEKKNLFSAYQQALSTQLANSQINPETVINDKRLLQGLVAMGALAMVMNSRNETRKKKEEQKELVAKVSTAAAVGVITYGIARSSVGKKLADAARQRLQKGRAVIPDPQEAMKIGDDVVEQVTGSAPNISWGQRLDDLTLPKPLDDLTPPRPIDDLGPELNLPARQADDLVDRPELNLLPRAKKDDFILLEITKDQPIKIVNNNLGEELVEDAKAVLSDQDNLDIIPGLSSVKPLSVSPKLGQNIEKAALELQKQIEQGQTNLSDSDLIDLFGVDYVSTRLGRKVSSTARAGKVNVKGLDLADLPTLAKYPSRTSRQLINELVNKAELEIEELDHTVNAILDKAFAGKLANNKKITKVVALPPTKNSVGNRYAVYQAGSGVRPTVVSTTLDQAALDSYISLIRAKREELIKVLLDDIYDEQLTKQFVPRVNKLKATADKFQRLNDIQSNKIRAEVNAYSQAGLETIAQLDRLPSYRIKSQDGQGILDLTPSTIIGSGGQYGKDYLAIQKLLPNNNQVQGTYLRFFFRDNQLKGLALRYRLNIREDVKAFLAQPNLTREQLENKIQELQLLRANAKETIEGIRNRQKIEFDVFMNINVKGKDKLIARQQAKFDANAQYYLSSIESEIDYLISLI